MIGKWHIFCSNIGQLWLEFVSCQAVNLSTAHKYIYMYVHTYVCVIPELCM